MTAELLKKIIILFKGKKLSGFVVHSNYSIKVPFLSHENVVVLNECLVNKGMLERN